MYDVTWEYDVMEDQQVDYEQTLPIALLPMRCPKFQVGDDVIHMHSQTGERKRIVNAYFEAAYPARWRYQLEGGTRWYQEADLWTAEDWREYLVQRSIYKLRWDNLEQKRLNPPPPPQWCDYVTALVEPFYGLQVRQYQQAFVDYVDTYFGAWKPPVELYNEYMECIGFRSY